MYVSDCMILLYLCICILPITVLYLFVSLQLSVLTEFPLKLLHAVKYIQNRYETVPETKLTGQQQQLHQVNHTVRAGLASGQAPN